MGDNVVPFKKREPDEVWLMSYDVVRRPDGSLIALLTAAAIPEIETNETVRERGIRFTQMLIDAAEHNRAAMEKIDG